MPARSVLIVDDSPAIRKALCEFFTLQGDFEVCGEAENGREAIERAQLLQPALIVTDLSMPLMNGLEETRILKKLMPAVPVCSAKTSPTSQMHECQCKMPFSYFSAVRSIWFIATVLCDSELPCSCPTLLVGLSFASAWLPSRNCLARGSGS